MGNKHLYCCIHLHTMEPCVNNREPGVVRYDTYVVLKKNRPQCVRSSEETSLSRGNVDARWPQSCDPFHER